MKKFIFCLCALTLNACNTVSSLKSDDFLTSKSVDTDHSMLGFWSGSAGPYIMTMKITNDGTSRFCSSWNDKKNLGKITFDGEKFILEDGSKLKLQQLNNKKMILTANYYLQTTKYQFYKDDDLSKASLFCHSVLKNKK